MSFARRYAGCNTCDVTRVNQPRRADRLWSIPGRSHCLIFLVSAGDAQSSTCAQNSQHMFHLRLFHAGCVTRHVVPKTSLRLSCISASFTSCYTLDASRVAFCSERRQRCTAYVGTESGQFDGDSSGVSVPDDVMTSIDMALKVWISWQLHAGCVTPCVALEISWPSRQVKRMR